MAGSLGVEQAYFESLLASARAPARELNAIQGGLLTALCRHAVAEVPRYRSWGHPPASLDTRSPWWTARPFLTRRDIAAAPAQFAAASLPPFHGEISRIQTGGSTGAPALRLATSLESLARLACSYRIYADWNLDQSLPLISLRNPQFGTGRNDAQRFRCWGFPWLPEGGLGRRHHLDAAAPAADQLDLVCREAPAYLNIFPSALLRLIHEARRRDLRPPIPAILSVGEYLPPEVRAAAAATFGSRVIDILSSAEAGVIAVTCPDTGLLHLQSEQVAVEILRDDGSPCGEGEPGELVVTPLYNYAAPLLRYRSGDYAEWGTACSCGRSLPTLARFLGRREHMFLYPDGRRALPPIDRLHLTGLIGHDAWVFAQTGPGDAELRIAGEPPGGTGLLAHLEQATAGAFRIALRRVAALPLTSAGKRHFTVNEIKSS